MDISKYISDDICKFLKNSISEAQGNEVFFTGLINEEGIVTSAKIGSRGNEHRVPVNFTDQRQGHVLIHNHPSGLLKASDADLNVASLCAENAQGFYIINNDASDIYVVIEPVKAKKILKLDCDKSAEYISNGGQLSKISENFEERESQIELLKKVAKSFNENRLGVFEAGTGVGKSYAYLIPSILWAINNKERIIISTGTINLQQQLCEKDIPAVEKILETPVKYILLKGRQNYICKRRLNEAASMRDLFEEENENLNEVFKWAQNSQTGDKSELTFMPSENVWSKVNSESDACMGMRCPFHNECFVMKVRKEASATNIIVVNHHLLFADIESRMNGAGYEDAAVLPPYKRIVFDEAHKIENAATSFFSESLTRFKINKLINQMYRRRKNSESGHLCTLAILSSNEEKADLAQDIVSRIKNSILNLEIAGMDLMNNNLTMRLSSSTCREFSPFLVAVSELEKNLAAFIDLIRRIVDGISDDDKEVPAYWESKIVLRRLDSCLLLLKDFSLWDEKKDQVFWIQKKKLPPAYKKDKEDNPDFIVLNQTPLDISHMMNAGVFEEMDSVVTTSATLKTGNNFSFWMHRIGLSFADQERLIAAEFKSPFPYEKNMLLAVPNDAPFPDQMEYQQYIEMALPLLINASEGRTLVLFTSYDSLKNAHSSVTRVMKGFSGRIMRQGQDDNSKLLEAFKNEKESVLFATDSFWEGVDVPGDSLQQVIIVKLPFSVPSDPVFAARAEALEKKGMSPFMELSLPEAVIKFRQGIGRLIRRSDDKGVVTVLDRRIFEKRYGMNFIASIPECKKIYEPLQNLTKRINDFIFD
ncbi:MAG: DEAD/DEAH box helicase family protein [Treponema sp.]|nr:DEAD/DEAH box helicase family protein [Treponema sp.]